MSRSPSINPPPLMLVPSVFAWLCLLPVTSAPAVTVEVAFRLAAPGESSVQGELTSVGNDHLIVSADAGPLTIDAERLPVVRFIDGREEAAVGAGRVWLMDGSTLPLDELTTQSDGAEVELTLPAAVGIRPAGLRVRSEQVQSLRFPGARPGLEEDWEKIRDPQNAATADRLVLVRREAESLDYVEGIVTSIREATVELLMDDEPVEVSRQRLYGVVFGVADEPSAALALPLVSSAGGVKLRAERMRLVDGQLELETPAGLPLRLPAEGLSAIDFSAGRVVALSDIRPASTRLSPLFGTPRAFSREAPWAAVQADRSYWGTPLTVRGSSAEGELLIPFDKGLAVRSGGEVAYQLRREFRQLAATVGIDPGAAGPRRLRLIVSADGKALLEREYTSDSAAIELAASVEGVNELRLRVEAVESLDATLHLGDARLLR